MTAEIVLQTVWGRVSDPSEPSEARLSSAAKAASIRVQSARLKSCPSQFWPFPTRPFPMRFGTIDVCYRPFGVGFV
jgi:hypothetical protein